MAGELWSYFVPYQMSVEKALKGLRQSVFAAGQFRGSEMQPATPEEALSNMEESGTASILDMMGISESPEICSICPVPDEWLKIFFGTTEPTHAMIESSTNFYDEIERGQGIYITVFKDRKPVEYFFAGYSFD